MQRGDESSARVLAKQMVRLRDQKAKTQKMKSNVTATGYNAQVTHINHPDSKLIYYRRWRVKPKWLMRWRQQPRRWAP